MTFPAAEFRARVARIQAQMAKSSYAALLVTTETDVRYITGFLTRFWESPTRPWFVIVPASGDPVAVIPSIGAELMGRSWLTDIRTWGSPDLLDDGVTLLTDTLREVANGGQIATPMEAESHLRMPLADFQRITEALSIVSDKALLRDLKCVKSPAEIARTRAACGVADRAFARVPDIAHAGVPLNHIYRQFQILCLQEGADHVPFIAGAAAPGGYGDVISPATDRPLETGDVLMIDTGAQKDGYFSDFDRNYSVGPPAPDTAQAFATLIDATQAAFDIAKPGATMSDLFHAMDRICTGGAGGTEAGRFGHGLGQQLTEWPSIIPTEHMVLQTGMVLTLEPGITIAPGRGLVHEENIVITETGAEYLSTPSPHQMTVI